MTNKVRSCRRAVDEQGVCVTDVQYATELAFRDALGRLGWSKPKAARSLRVALNTVRNWCDGRATPDICVLITCPELMREWQSAFAVRYSEVLTRRVA
jgi:hypothetical protein